MKVTPNQNGVTILQVKKFRVSILQMTSIGAIIVKLVKLGCFSFNIELIWGDAPSIGFLMIRKTNLGFLMNVTPGFFKG